MRKLTGLEPHFSRDEERSRLREYEARKTRWSVEHPHATPLEYSQAMLRIAKELGI